MQITIIIYVVPKTKCPDTPTLCSIHWFRKICIQNRRLYRTLLTFIFCFSLMLSKCWLNHLFALMATRNHTFHFFFHYHHHQHRVWYLNFGESGTNLCDVLVHVYSIIVIRYAYAVCRMLDAGMPMHMYGSNVLNMVDSMT